MKLLVLATALALVAAAPKPQGYDLPVPQGQRLSHGGCAEGEVANVDGSCAVPDVTRHVYVYTPPEEAVQRNPSPPLPNPKVEYNVLFIRSPDNNKGRDPIIVPPPANRVSCMCLTSALRVAKESSKSPDIQPRARRCTSSTTAPTRTQSYPVGWT